MKTNYFKEELKKHVKQILITEKQIKKGIKRAAKFIDNLYDGKPIVLVSILKGSFIFLADVCRELTVPSEIDFMCAKSYYEGTTTTGKVNIVMDLHRDIKDCHVVIIEDIVDTGRTLTDILKLLKDRGPASLHVVTLLDKPSRRLVDFSADLSLFVIPDLFVVGYGLDCAELFRSMPYIAEFGG